MNKLLLAVCLALAAAPTAASALDLPAASLAGVAVSPPAHAALPRDLVLRDQAGRARPFIDAGDTPRVLVFADYACTTLCGPALAIVARRLSETHLRAQRDYRLQVIGLDPASRGAEAASFVRRSAPDLPTETFTGDAVQIAAATRALGYGYVYDPAARAYAHPVAAFVLTPDGRLTAALSEIALSAGDLGAALRSARSGAAPGFVQALAVACHGALQTLGGLDTPILWGLRLAGGATVVGGATALLLLGRRRRRIAA